MKDFDMFIPPQIRGNAMDPFTYGVFAANLLAGAAVQPTLAIQNDSDFLAVFIVGTARNPAAPSIRFVAPALSVAVEDQGSGRLLQNQPIHWDEVVGDAQDPFPLPIPKWFKGGSTVAVTIVNLDTVQAYDVRLAFSGFKVFNFKPGI